MYDLNKPMTSQDFGYLTLIFFGALIIAALLFIFIPKSKDYPELLDDERGEDQPGATEKFYISELLTINKSLTKDLQDAFKVEEKLSNEKYADKCTIEDLKRSIIAQESVITNLRKDRHYPQQKFYNPKDHKAPTIYICAIWREYYMVRQSNELAPSIMTIDQWKETYGHYDIIPAQNRNLKNIA